MNDTTFAPAPTDADAPFVEGFDPCATNPLAVIPYEDDAPLVPEIDGPPKMPDAEAFQILKRISATQSELADIDANAKTMKAQAVADLRTYLGHFDRLPRLEQWHASKLRGKRRSVTVLTGSIGKKTVPARCVVADVGLALPWLKANCPAAVVEKIDAKRLPEPLTGYDAKGEIKWSAPGPGLDAQPEREEILINGRQLRTLLAGETEGDSDDE